MPRAVHLIRHAESTANLSGDIVGGVEAKLTVDGITQAKRLGQWLRDVGARFDHVFFSPYRRTTDTMDLTLGVMGSKAKPVADARLVEIDRGEWDGKLIKKVITDDIRAKMRAEELDFRAPGGETMREVGERMYDWLESVKCVPTDEIVVAFTHGHAIRSLLARAFEIEPTSVRHIGIFNTSITTLRWTPSTKHGWRIDCINSMPHQPMIIGPDTKTWAVQ